MTEPDPDAPLPKTPAPPLFARAPRPHAVRIRKPAVQLAVLAAAVLLAGALAWAFVVQPGLRAAAREREAQVRDEPDRRVRPSERITDGPAGYDRLGEAGTVLPEPDHSPPANPDGHPAPRTAHPGGTQSSASQARAAAVGSPLFFAGAAVRVSAPAAVGPVAGPDIGPPSRAAPPAVAGGLHPPASPYELKAGTVAPALLLTAVDTSRPGPVVAVISQNVFDSVSGRHLLLPQGARLIGRHEGDSAYGERRVFLVWERVILPNGKSLSLSGEPGVDGQGAVGVQGRVDHRLWPLSVAVLFAGAITTFGEVGRAAAGDDDGDGSFIGEVGDAAPLEAARVGGRLIDRELEVRPVIRVRPGEPVRVLITRDLILEPYVR